MHDEDQWQGRERRDDRHGRHRGHHGRSDDEGFAGRGRVERGAMRYVLLDALRDGPKHGYEIIKWLEERTNGAYAPSPGGVYPTLQLLSDLGLVHADQDIDRRVYSLTDAGRAALDEHAETIGHFWSRFTGAATSRVEHPEIAFLRDELDELARTVWSGVRPAVGCGDQATVRAIRATVERCKNEVREIIAHGVTAAAADEPTHRTRDSSTD